MILSKKFGIIGGDIRQYYLGKLLEEDGHSVKTYGIETPKNDLQKSDSLEEIINFSEYIIFPVPTTRDKKTINAPFFNQGIYINSKLFELLKDKTVFAFNFNILSFSENNVKNSGIKLFDYNTEEFQILNSYPTAEGMIKIATDECKMVIKECSSLVVGYGRIGKVLSNLLKSIGSDVTVSARKKSDVAWAQMYGCKGINIAKSKKNIDYDIIFNTVPHLIFDKKLLSKCSSNTIIIDAASMPGGVDKKEAEKQGIRVIHALGIPGKYFPKSSAEIIKSTIYSIMEGNNL